MSNPISMHGIFGTGNTHTQSAVGKTAQPRPSTEERAAAAKLYT